MREDVIATNTGNPTMFTLKDAISLANLASQHGTMSPEDLQYKSATLGDYVLTNEQALNELDRLKSGKHAPDGAEGLNSINLPGGKLPSHVTFSEESPYYIEGFKATEGGSWTKDEDGWTYTPSESQIERDPNYLSRLRDYYDREKGNGIDKIVLPNGKVIQ